MGYVKRIAGIAAVAAITIAGPAQAGQVIVVDGDHAQRVEDPSVPTRAEIALGMPTGASAARVRARSSTKSGRRAVYAALRRELRREHISRSAYRRWRTTFVRSLRTLRRLSGARATQLAYVLTSVESLALRRRLGATRMPVAFLQLERNRQYWPRKPYPAPGDQVSFRGSEILFQYFAGEGLQLHPLSTFKKANHLHGFCERKEASCDERALRRILNEMTKLAVKRGRSFIAWEYLFYFGGGTPPWMSGMAQATGIQALGRAAKLLGEPKYLDTARRALGAFETAPPSGVRTTGFRGGVHYLQYSFAPRLYIFNAFLQSLIGLHDFAQAGRRRARAGALPRRRAGGARGDPIQRRGRLVALQLRGPRVEQRLPRAAARVPGEHVHAPAGTAVLRLRPPLPRLPDRSARAHLEGPGCRDRGPAGRDPLQRVQALRHRGEGHEPERQARLQPPCDVPPRGRRLHLDPAWAGSCSR